MTLAFVQLPVDVCRDLDGEELKTLFGLHQFADLFGWCWPGQRRLANAAGQALATLNRALQRLAARGAIEIHRRGGRKTNRYRIAERFRVRRDCSTGETKGIAKRDSEFIDTPESLNAARESKRKRENSDLERCAPLPSRSPLEATNTAPTPPAGFAAAARGVVAAVAARLHARRKSPALKANIKAMLRQKHSRYLQARGRPGEVTAYWAALMNEDAESQRVFDAVDKRMRAERWDDVPRDRWQALA